MAQKAGRLVVPQFKTEEDEAQWWYDNRDKVEEALLNAMDEGTIRRGVASRNVTIRMAEADLDMARKQAEAKGLPYQTYIKSVLHEELTKRERHQAS
jgi:predicted DNA binding CopG/RHH family protein